MGKRLISLDEHQFAQLMHWLADHINEVPVGQSVTPTWAVREILRRYFKSQETMRQVLRREESR